MVGKCPNCGNSEIGAGEVDVQVERSLRWSGTIHAPRHSGTSGRRRAPQRALWRRHPARNRRSRDSGGTGGNDPGNTGKTAVKRLLVISVIVAVTVLAALLVNSWFDLFSIGYSVELAPPEGFIKADSSQIAELEKSDSGSVDFLYSGQDGLQGIACMHDLPLNDVDVMNALPDTCDIDDMETYILENRVGLQECCAGFFSGGYSAKALSLACGRMALETSGWSTIGNKKVDTTLLFIKKGLDIYNIVVIEYGQQGDSGLVDYVAANLDL